MREKLAILVGGGPAPGINGVISAATIEAVNQGKDVMGILDGFKHLSKGKTDKSIPLTIDAVSRIHNTGGTILRTSRENPTKDPEKMKNVVSALTNLGIKYLLTIGGDDTAYSASKVEEAVSGKILVAHIPKTIDNDLPLPGGMPTFGFQTARHLGVQLVQNLMEDAKSTGRWYLVIAMGRSAGHLALGMGRAAGATVTVIAEELPKEKISMKRVCDILTGSIIKRLASGKDHGVAVIGEGIALRFDEEEMKELKDVERDEHGHIRIAEIPLGKVLKNRLKDITGGLGLKVGFVEKDIGYELRCNPPIPFDAEYTRNLGYGGVRFLLEGGSGAMVIFSNDKITPLYFKDMLDPATKKTRVRLVDINSESYKIARKYMLRLEKEDFEGERLKRLADIVKLAPEEFKKRFGYLAE
ncbi:MAG: 6-phosphofructokinase [Nitrospirae bacterium]|nr:6-phosphofructokinase [Nitrospirota bacterium]